MIANLHPGESNYPLAGQLADHDRFWPDQPDADKLDAKVVPQLDFVSQNLNFQLDTASNPG